MDDERERTTMDEEGGVPDPPGEADRAVEEAGGGESEGFEQAERDLEEQATHGDVAGSPEADAFTPERESDESGAEYGEADQEGDPEDAA